MNSRPRGIAALTSSIVRASSARCGHIVATGCLTARPPSISACNMSSGSESECTHHQDRGASLRGHLQRLRSSPSETLLLDGGTGEELFLRGVPDDRKIWSATAITHVEYHSVVEDVHKSFLQAGSQAVTTNSYGITPGVGFTDGEEVQRLVGKAGEIARRAVDNSGALVLGSLGPQVESYRPDLIMDHDDGVRAYLNAIAGLHPHVDAYLAETMSCVEEACQAVDAVSRLDAPHPMMVSLTLNGSGKVRSGESVVDAIPKLAEYAKERGVECVINVPSVLTVEVALAEV
ncbi:hypothetical protein ACHAXT_004373 [Thalassiosira profunda]